MAEYILFYSGEVLWTEPFRNKTENSCDLFFQAIVWDDGLTGPFGLIAEYSLLKVMWMYFIAV